MPVLKFTIVPTFSRPEDLLSDFINALSHGIINKIPKFSHWDYRFGPLRPDNYNRPDYYLFDSFEGLDKVGHITIRASLNFIEVFFKFYNMEKQPPFSISFYAFARFIDLFNHVCCGRIEKFSIDYQIITSRAYYIG